MPRRTRKNPLIADDVHIESEHDAFDTSDVFDDEQRDFYEDLVTSVSDPSDSSIAFDDEVQQP
jgi:hypothetical protein